MLIDELKELLGKEKLKYGFSKIDYGDFAVEYKCALVIAVPYGKQLTLDIYSEKAFEQGICGARDAIDRILPRVEKILKMYSVKYYIPPVVQSNETDLKAPFSFKFAAVNAALGWIGKNDVLITQEYGPRVRLSAILCDYDFQCGTPIIESKCPDECVECVRACPYKAISGRKWNIHSKREELINYYLCNQKRELFIEKNGRKNACGICMAACPLGK